MLKFNVKLCQCLKLQNLDSNKVEWIYFCKSIQLSFIPFPGLQIAFKSTSVYEKAYSTNFIKEIVYEEDKDRFICFYKEDERKYQGTVEEFKNLLLKRFFDKDWKCYKNKENIFRY